MTGVILAYLFYFVASSASPLQIRWLKAKNIQGGEIALTFWIMLIVATFGTILPLISVFKLVGNPLELIGLGFLCGLFGAGYFVASYVAQKHVEAGVTTLALNVNTPFTILLSSLLLGENLKSLQFLGAALLLIALFLISKKHRTGRFKFDKYFLLMLASGLMIGGVYLAERALQIKTGFSAGTLISWWSQCIALGAAALIFRSRNQFSPRDTLITGVLRFFQALSYVLLIYVVGNLSIVSAVTTFKVVVIFIAAALFLKEREDLPRKIIGSLIAVAGLLLMR